MFCLFYKQNIKKEKFAFIKYFSITTNVTIEKLFNIFYVYHSKVIVTLTGLGRPVEF